LGRDVPAHTRALLPTSAQIRAVHYPDLCVDAFEAIEEPSLTGLADESAIESVAPQKNARLYLSTQLTIAEGEDQSAGFLVLEGAVGRREKKVMLPGYAQLRERLVQEGILREDGDLLTLEKSYLFDSPSAAASVLSGGNKNGRTEWRDARGRTLKDIQAQMTAVDEQDGDAPVDALEGALTEGPARKAAVVA
jgi:hypothetical protein